MDRRTANKAYAALDHIERWPDIREPEFQNKLVDFGVTPQEFADALLCLAAYNANGKNYYRGMMDVCHVFRNQAIKKNTTPYTQAALWMGDRPLALPSENDEFFNKVLDRVGWVCEGKIVDPTFGATGFTAGGHTRQIAVSAGMTYYDDENF